MDACSNVVLLLPYGPGGNEEPLPSLGVPLYILRKDSFEKNKAIRRQICLERLSTSEINMSTLFKMTSVERIHQYSKLEEEAAEHTEVRPSPGWPQHGHISLTNLCLTYIGTTCPAVGPLSVHFPPGQKV